MRSMVTAQHSMGQCRYRTGVGEKPSRSGDGAPPPPARGGGAPLISAAPPGALAMACMKVGVLVFLAMALLRHRRQPLQLLSALVRRYLAAAIAALAASMLRR
jgi:hypothetical protein